jgi:hypothetical protein
MPVHRGFLSGLLVGAVAIVLLAAASARSADGGTLLQRTLLVVSSDAALGGSFEFGDVSAQRMLAGIPAGTVHRGNRIWGSIVGVGASVDAPERHRPLPQYRRESIERRSGAERRLAAEHSA